MTIMFIEPSHIDFIIKMANIAHNGFIFHGFEMTSFYNVFIPCCRHHNICFWDGCLHPFHWISIHGRLQCTNRINFCNNYTGTSTSQRGCRSFTYITIASHNGHFPGHHYISRSTNSIYQRFFTAIFIIKL